MSTKSLQRTTVSQSLLFWVRTLPATGLFEEIGPGRFRLRVTQTELTTALGYSKGSGSLSRRLQRLERAGLVISRRPLTIDLSTLATQPALNTAALQQGPRSFEPSPGAGFEGLQDEEELSPTRLWVLLERAVDEGLELLAIHLLGMLSDQALAGSPPSPLSSERDSAAKSREPRRSSRSFREKQGDLENSVYTEPSLHSSRCAGSADRALRAHPRRRVDLEPLISPLLEECVLRGLPGVTNLPGLLTALESLSDEEVVRGVAFVLAQMRSGVPVHSPFGLLAVLAARRP